MTELKRMTKGLIKVFEEQGTVSPEYLKSKLETMKEEINENS